MKNQILKVTVAGLLWIGMLPATAQTIPVSSVASVTPTNVILDVYADTDDIPLRGFSFKVNFDPGELTFTSGGRYDGLWFLRGENSVSYAYTDVTQPNPDEVRVVGGRLDGDHPGEGVAGSQLILATLVFKRLNGSDPEMELSFGSPPPFVNFAAANGESLDSAVEFQKVEVQSAPEDSDKDGLPDQYELDTYDDLVTSDGSSDTDGDGDSDLDEWLRGTDPTDPNSKFVIQIVLQPDGSKVVLWTGSFNRVYDLEWSPNLQGFTPIATGVPGLAPLLERLDELNNGDPNGFYRVKTKFPTAGR